MTDQEPGDEKHHLLCEIQQLQAANTELKGRFNTHLQECQKIHEANKKHCKDRDEEIKKLTTENNSLKICDLCQKRAYPLVGNGGGLVCYQCLFDEYQAVDKTLNTENLALRIRIKELESEK